jgi:hypothetical protein
MEPNPQKLSYARPEPKWRTNWEQIGWTIAALLFMLMCLCFAYMLRNP